MDRVSPAKRRENMQKIRNKNTGTELAVRRIIFNMGFRYRLYDASLPGTPDIVFRKRRKVIFVHGCFWHQHEGCKEAFLPTSNTEYWLPKLQKNIERDKARQKELEVLGWRFLVVWECQLDKPEIIKEKIRKFLN